MHDHGQTFSLERNLEVAPDHEEEDAAHGRVVFFEHAPDGHGAFALSSRVLRLLRALVIMSRRCSPAVGGEECNTKHEFR